MKEILKFLSFGLYFGVGIICFVMALKSLTLKKFMPFHEQAAKKPWEKIDSPLQSVILFMAKLGGLGFLVTSILLLVCPVAPIHSISLQYPELL